MHYTLYCEADLYLGSVFFNTVRDMRLARSLPDKSIIVFDCVDCGAENNFEREGISNGFSYLEDPHDEIYTCTECECEHSIDSHLYGFVEN